MLPTFTHYLSVSCPSQYNHPEIQMAHAQIRQSIRRLRRQLNPQQQQQATQAVCHHLLHNTRVNLANNIALFFSFDGELDTQPIIELLWRQNKSVYLPVLHPFSPGNLLFLRYSPQTELIINALGIRQPRLDVTQIIPVAKLDIIFTPLVAFDACGNRLGMGSGYYDRTLQHWQQNKSYPIGLAHDCQLVSEIANQEWDIPLPEIITPTKRWLFIEA